jgi:hypothetical protein
VGCLFLQETFGRWVVVWDEMVEAADKAGCSEVVIPAKGDME